MALTLQHLRHRTMKILAIALLASTLSACNVTEIDITSDWDAKRLYEEARTATDDGDWTLAQNYYSKLESRYPFGRYAQQAQIDLAYVYWRDGEPAQAIAACDRFLKQYPNHENSDYVLYLKALATLNEPNGLFSGLFKQDIAERDADAARTAFDTFKELVQRFPESRYAPESRRRMHELVLAQARHELNVAEFYFERHAYLAAIDRAQNVVRQFQQTPYSDGALELIKRCYQELGLPALESDIQRIVDANQNRERNVQ